MEYGDQRIWQGWAVALQRLGVQEWVADFLEAAGPVRILGAQFVYLGEPLLNLAWSRNQLDTLARLLEDSTQTREFVKLLREASE